MKKNEPSSLMPQFDFAPLHGIDDTPVFEKVHEMIAAYAVLHSAVTNSLRDLEQSLRDGTLTKQDAISKLRKDILPKCQSCRLLGAVDLIQKAITSHNRNYGTDLVTELTYITIQAIDDGQDLMLFPVDRNRAKYFNQEKPFGDLIARKFPDMQKDLMEAGNCYALDRHTACVIHLMRALESALRSLGKSLKGFTFIKTAVRPTMGQIATELKKYADTLPNKTKKDMEFKDKIQAASIHFKDITNVIRNKAAHTNQFYDADQAHFILSGTRLFLDDLVAVVKTPRRKATSN